MISAADLIEYEENIRAKEILRARDEVYWMGKYCLKDFAFSQFHDVYYKILQMFADGKIKKLMISVASQHGKSTGSTILLPPYLLGKDPNKKCAVVCYNSDKARAFGRQIKRLMSGQEYRQLFDTRLATAKDANYENTSMNADIPGRSGFLKCVGYKGGLSGDPVDILLMDDLYKGYEEGNSPIVRQSVQDWYITVARARLHNHSQELIVFTRWHENDLIGFLSQNSGIKVVQTWDDINQVKPGDWVRINFPAIKPSEPTELDPREQNQALWPEKHSLHKLREDEKLDPMRFACVQQGDPGAAIGRLYKKFRTYTRLPETLGAVENFTDVADKGNDFLASVCYRVDFKNGDIYVIDLVYSNQPQESTGPWVGAMLERNECRNAVFESNGGGVGFIELVSSIVSDRIFISPFHQSANKESRIITQYTQVNNRVLFPSDFMLRWPEVYNHLTLFKRDFSSNLHDDIEDCLTAIVEFN